MKNTRVFLLMAGLASMGCPADPGEGLRKLEIDEDQLAEGATVTIDGDLAQVELPFTEPADNVEPEDFVDEMTSAVMMTIRSNTTGASANFMNSTLVAGQPTEPGEYTWELNSARTAATITFYNQAPNSLQMTPGATYSVELSIGFNEYVERVPSLSFTVTAE